MTRAADLRYRVLITTARLSGHHRLGPHWRRVWDWAAHRDGDVRTKLFGRSARFKSGAIYPVFARRWATYNDPVVEVVHQAALVAGGPVDVVDVGAAMGDTAMLLRASCAADLRRIVSVEGDPVYYGYLEKNVAGDPGATAVFAAVSDTATMPELVRHPSGTASATGTSEVAARTLDGVMEELAFTPGVIKIDTDGYDGRVLGGARSTLTRCKPWVLFEWDPGSFLKTANDWHQPFEVLAAAGYRHFVWFTKYGEFSHYLIGNDRATVDLTARDCLETQERMEWHYDVAAVPEKDSASVVALADLGYARRNKARP